MVTPRKMHIGFPLCFCSGFILKACAVFLQTLISW